METQNLKQEAHQLVENLPENATWDDLMREVDGRQAIEAGLKDGREGRNREIEEVRDQFGLSS